MIQLTDFLFPDIPLAVRALAYLSEIGVIVHFAKDSFDFYSITPSARSFCGSDKNA